MRESLPRRRFSCWDEKYSGRWITTSETGRELNEDDLEGGRCCRRPCAGGGRGCARAGCNRFRCGQPAERHEQARGLPLDRRQADPADPAGSRPCRRDREDPGEHQAATRLQDQPVCAGPGCTHDRHRAAGRGDVRQHPQGQDLCTDRPHPLRPCDRGEGVRRHPRVQEPERDLLLARRHAVCGGAEPRAAVSGCGILLRECRRRGVDRRQAR